MTVHLTVIPTTGAAHGIDCEPENVLTTAQTAVGGLVEIANYSAGDDGSKYALVNEEGLLLGLKYNPVGSEVVGYAVVGPVVLIDQKDFQ